MEVFLNLDPLIVLSHSIIKQASEILENGDADHHPLGSLVTDCGSFMLVYFKLSSLTDAERPIIEHLINLVNKGNTR